MAGSLEVERIAARPRSATPVDQWVEMVRPPRPESTGVRISGGTVLICDRLRAVAESLAEFLRATPGLTVHGVATTAPELLTLLAARRPELVVLDSTVRHTDGALVAAVRTRHPETKVLMIGPAEDSNAVAGALREGALGWLTVDTSAAQLVEAAHGVLRGEYRIAPTLLAAALGAGTDSTPPTSRVPQRDAGAVVDSDASSLVDRLSRRERLVLSCLVGGLHRREIAARLGIAETTARTHISRILVKLDAHSMVEAAAMGRRAGLAAPEP